MVAETVEYIVKSLVDHPDEVEVQATTAGNTIEVLISVAGDDMGRVIGRNGRVINAMRTVTQALADRDGMQVSLEVS
jgi:predicted RNA-binding protein YlqC (UPF0109 family)